MRRLLLLALAAAAAGCGGDDGPERRTTPGAIPRATTTSAGTTTQGELRLEPVASGYTAPLQALAHPETGELVVVEQGGLVKAGEEGRVLHDLRDRVTSAGSEQGLLSIAFHPEDAERLYASFTDTAGDSRVVELGPEGERELLRVEQPYENHNGGYLLFGPDGRLYLGLGDGGAAFDPEGRSQDPDSRLGKLLRTDVDAAQPEWEQVALGLRNPWRFSFDDGDLWIGDVGQDLWEEVNVVRGFEGGLLNFGWDVFEGNERVEDGELGPGRVVEPVAQYGHDLGCSITGGHVVTEGSLAGRYVYGDYCSGRIFTLDAESGGDVREEAFSVEGLTSFGRDADGRTLLVAGDGRILRLAG